MPSGKSWTLYLCVGRLIWATGGHHVVRRLYRHLSKQCPNLSLDMMVLREQSGFDYGWDYQVINILVLRKKIAKEQAKEIISQILFEILFDIVQYEARGSLSYQEECSDLAQSAMGILTLLSIKPILRKLSQMWMAWQKAKLGYLLLQAAPQLQNLDRLKQVTSPQAYDRLEKIANGKRTFRDIANLLKQDEVTVVRSLSGLIRKGFIRLISLADFPHPGLLPTHQFTSGLTMARQRPLVACVDDSYQICWEMEQIVQKAGYEFLAIQDSVRALGLLIDRKPDLIFMDLTMPIVSGYELCAQIRRVSALQTIEIVILTGNTIESLRGRLLGVSDCLSKPIQKEKIVGILHKYLAVSPAPTRNPIKHRSRQRATVQV
ncbi:response regulator [Oscillatoriales cyanobacterium LEGE 11467]|uniref:Protein PatA n=1 Tax=Zarconia navalis LEGE 11467 TaxID=1828826 RepID=A0A928Z7K7_9CYAN|nr:response regulator [Zarconia navalis]MBE9040630.1 response regulator [Zarconia navalis LEGE 11467]